MSERRVERGIFATDSGWRIYVKHQGRLRTKRLPAAKTLPAVRRARDDFAAELRRLEPIALAPTAETFAADVDRYLRAVASMPTFRTREYEMARWVEAFGRRRRRTIGTPEIDAVLHAWYKGGLAGSTVKHRRTALMHLWSLLDGPGAPNPVQHSFCPPGADAEPRGLPYGLITAILRRMRWTKTRARLAVIAWTGLAHAQVRRLQPADIDWAGRLLFVRARHKGAGHPPYTKPLTDEGLAALRAFAELDAWGHFSQGSLYRSFKVAAAKLCLHVGRDGGIRPYDLRHSYGTAIYRASGDLRATQAAMGHGRIATTMRYTLGAVDERMAIAIRAFGTQTQGARFAEKVTGPVATDD